MNVIVTGGLGFIGTNFLQYLADTGHRGDVANIDCKTYAANVDNLDFKLLNERFGYFAWYNVNIAKSKKCLRNIFDSIKPDVVINFAAESHVDRSIKSSRKFLKTNVLGTGNMLDLCVEFGTKFVQVSTDEVYGSLSADDPSSVETDQLYPNSPYSASKASADLLVRSYVKTHGLNACITRCSNNYGSYQYPEKLIPLMTLKALSGEPLPVYGSGDNIRDWIHVSDHCRGIWEVARNGRKGEIYNMGGKNSEVTNNDIVKKIIEITGSDSKIEYVADRKGHDFRYSINFDKMKKEFDWEPKVDFDQGLRQTIDWYRSRQEDVS